MKGKIFKAMCGMMSMLVFLGQNYPNKTIPSFLFFGEPDFPEE